MLHANYYSKKYGGGDDLSDESLNNIIAQLRKKFQQDQHISIQTYPCIGYQLDF
ncbi:MAG: helix-turn-helix domain-containing protein [Parabacteroides sp.]|nr:helix-turn-helix domain-containing protein [Parabacteroides sp.]